MNRHDLRLGGGGPGEGRDVNAHRGAQLQDRQGLGHASLLEAHDRVLADVRRLGEVPDGQPHPAAARGAGAPESPAAPTRGALCTSRSWRRRSFSVPTAAGYRAHREQNAAQRWYIPIDGTVPTAAARRLSFGSSGSGGSQEPARSPPFPIHSIWERGGEGRQPAGRLRGDAESTEEYVADDSMRSAYWQARSTVAANLGDIAEANRSWDAAFARDRPRSSSRALCKVAVRRTRSMSSCARPTGTPGSCLAKSTSSPQTRSIMIPLLGATEEGFRTLAVETLNDDMVAPTQRRGYADVATGTYTADPVFAAGNPGGALSGTGLSPTGDRAPQTYPAGDPHYAQNFRESGQARNLKERIYDGTLRPKWWSGRRAHVYEQTDKDASGEWRPMAPASSKRMTGIDPFSVYLATYTEAGDRSSSGRSTSGPRIAAWCNRPSSWPRTEPFTDPRSTRRSSSRAPRMYSAGPTG